MRLTVTVSLLGSASFVVVQGLSLLPLLDIQNLLSSLGPANANDPRFTTHSPPGPGDGRLPSISSKVDPSY